MQARSDSTALAMAWAMTSAAEDPPGCPALRQLLPQPSTNTASPSAVVRTGLIALSVSVMRECGQLGALGPSASLALVMVHPRVVLALNALRSCSMNVRSCRRMGIAQAAPCPCSGHPPTGRPYPRHTRLPGR